MVCNKQLNVLYFLLFMSLTILIFGLLILFISTSCDSTKGMRDVEIIDDTRKFKIAPKVKSLSKYDTYMNKIRQHKEEEANFD